MSKIFDATSDSETLFNKYLDEIKARGGLEVTIGDIDITDSEINNEVNGGDGIVTGGAIKKPAIVVVDRKQMSATTADPMLRKLFHNDVDTQKSDIPSIQKRKSKHMHASTVTKPRMRDRITANKLDRFADVSAVRHERYDGIGIANETVGSSDNTLGSIADEVDSTIHGGIADEIESTDSQKYSEYLDTNGYDSETDSEKTEADTDNESLSE